MKTAAIEPADGARRPACNAAEQAERVVQHGLGLPGRWTGARRFVVVDTGFGWGHRFLAAWACWRADPARCEELVCVALEQHPPRRADLMSAHAGTALARLASELAAVWPPLTPNVHVIDLEGGRVRLLLALGDVRRLLPQVSAQADAFCVDPATWDARLVAGLGRLAQPGATLVACTGAEDLRAALRTAGFTVRPPADADSAWPTTLAHYAPRFTPRRSRGRRPADPGTERHALIIGAGIAGACAAASLARLGWRCTVLDRHAAAAQEASGNPAGLFHGTAHVVDGVHTRLHRAAALFAARQYAPRVRSGQVPGACEGLRRAKAGAPWTGLPDDYVAWMDDGTTALYPCAGWVEPGALVRALLRHPRVTFMGRTAVVSLERNGPRWAAHDASGARIADAPVMVLAGAQGTAALLQNLGHSGWPTHTSRGQITWFASSQGLGLPITGEGYALGMDSGEVLCGATSQDGDLDPAVRCADHDFNLARLRALTGIEPEAGVALHGRVGWRWQTSDRLPIVGAVPAAAADIAAGTRLDHARFVPRMPGLFVLGGLGSRGLTWGPLAGEVLASWIDAAPMPIEADLLDAIDPARWVARAARSA